MRPSMDQVLMDVAFAIAQRSTCNRAHVGAVLAKDTRIISTGYNGSPAGFEHCPDPEPVGCTRTIHAETNAIAFAARHGISTEGSVLYCTMTPCVECAKILFNAGVEKVFYSEVYRIPDGLNYLIEGGMPTQQLIKE